MSIHNVPSDADASNTPRTVLRGVKHQLVSLGLDTLYLVIEYPHTDMFHEWAPGAGSLNDARLFAGIPYQGMILRRGLQGYKLSVWDGDARLLLTDRVNDTLTGTPQAGQGMGMLLQLGPKWLRLHGKAFAPKALLENVYAQLTLFGVKNPEKYRIRINRLDIALDVLGLDVASFSVDEWRQQWVGYAQLRNFHLSPRTGNLTGITIGSRKGNVCLTIYDKVTESEQDGDSLFWRSVWGVGEDDDITVTRFEWSFRPHQANSPNMRYLSDYTLEGFMGLLNYGSAVWGRLCIPGEDTNHKTRWALAPLWEELLAFIDEWSLDYERFIRPDYHLKPDIKPSYLNSAAGWLAGLQARIGVEKGKDRPVSLAQVLSFLHSEGHTLEDIDRKAAKKFEVFSKLAGVNHEELP